MTAPRPGSSMLALAALALAAACATPPDPASWKECGDGTLCPADAACFEDNRCLQCETVRYLPADLGWARCIDGRLCPPEVGCDADAPECMFDTCGDMCSCEAAETGCGNGIKADNEQCDDGNRQNGDGCDNNCTDTGCGNRIRTGSEQCDDGNLIDGDGCDSDCTSSVPPR